MPDRTRRLGGAALAGAFGICCALPVLGTLGLLGLLTGMSLASWTLAGLGAVAAVLGVRQLIATTHEEERHDQEL